MSLLLRSKVRKILVLQFFFSFLAFLILLCVGSMWCGFVSFLLRHAEAGNQLPQTETSHTPTEVVITISCDAFGQQCLHRTFLTFHGNQFSLFLANTVSVHSIKMTKLMCTVLYLYLHVQCLMTSRLGRT